MPQPSDLQLHQVRQEISRKVSFPEELSLGIDEEAARALLDEVNTCTTADDLARLTFSLSRKRLNDLFGAVLVISAAAGEEPFTRLLDIFKNRATMSLAETAWAFYQRHYPNDRLGRVLSTLLRSLESKSEPLGTFSELSSLTIDHKLPQRLADRLLKDPEMLDQARLPLSRQKPASRAAKTEVKKDQQAELENLVPIDQLKEKYPLLSSYTSLSLIPSDKQESACLQSGLCGYMVRLAILPETPFAAAFLTAYFQEASDQEILGNADLFAQALRSNGRQAQTALLQRYLRDYRMAGHWDVINSQILSLFGIPVVQDLSAMDLLPPPDKQDTGKPSDSNPFADGSASVKPGQAKPLAPAPEPAAASEQAPAAGTPARDKPYNPFLDNAAGRTVKPGPLAGASAATDPFAPKSAAGGIQPLVPPVAPAMPAAPAAPQSAVPADPGGDPSNLSNLFNWMRNRRREREKAATEAKARPGADKAGPAGEAAPDGKTPSVSEQVITDLQQALLAGLPKPEELAAAEPETEKSIWQLIDPASSVRFRQWAFMDMLRRHNGDNARKMLFFRRYALAIRDVRDYDGQTLIADFGSYAIADVREDEELVWYYDSNTISLLEGYRHNRTPLNKPQQKSISSREAMLQDTLSNIVRLSLDAVNLLYSHDFIQHVQARLKEKKS